MYTQALIRPTATTATSRCDARRDFSAHRRRRAHRAERLDAAAYRKTLTRQISSTPSEIVGISARRQLDHPAPTLRRKAALLAKGAGRVRPRALSLAPPRRSALREELVDLMSRRAKQNILDLHYPTLTWADIGAIGWLVDGAAIMNQIPLLPLLLRSLCARDDPRLPRRNHSTSARVLRSC